MKENDDSSIENQQEMNFISTDPTLVNQNPGLYTKPIVANNQIGIQNDNAEQPILVNQAKPMPVHVIPLSDINTWGSLPHNVTCPFCHQNVMTSVEANCNMGSCCLCFWLSCIIWAIILLCMGKEIGCADATHKCPNCKNVIGVYRSG